MLQQYSRCQLYTWYSFASRSESQLQRLRPPKYNVSRHFSHPISLPKLFHAQQNNAFYWPSIMDSDLTVVHSLNQRRGQSLSRSENEGVKVKCFQAMLEWTDIYLVEWHSSIQMTSDEWEKAHWTTVRFARGTVERSWLLVIVDLSEREGWYREIKSRMYPGWPE